MTSEEDADGYTKLTVDFADTGIDGFLRGGIYEGDASGASEPFNAPIHNGHAELLFDDGGTYDGADLRLELIPHPLIDASAATVTLPREAHLQPRAEGFRHPPVRPRATRGTHPAIRPGGHRDLAGRARGEGRRGVHPAGPEDQGSGRAHPGRRPAAPPAGRPRAHRAPGDGGGSLEEGELVVRADPRDGDQRPRRRAAVLLHGAAADGHCLPALVTQRGTGTVFSIAEDLWGTNGGGRRLFSGFRCSARRHQAANATPKIRSGDQQTGGPYSHPGSPCHFLSPLASEKHTAEAGAVSGGQVIQDLKESFCQRSENSPPPLLCPRTAKPPPLCSPLEAQRSQPDHRHRIGDEGRPGNCHRHRVRPTIQPRSQARQPSDNQGFCCRGS